MNNLSTLERLVLNNLSQSRNVSVTLGTKVQEVITNLNNIVVPPAPVIPEVIEEGTPVNAVAASKVLTLTGVVIHGETVEIGEDVYEFLADALQTAARPENIAVDIEAVTVKSAGSLAMATKPTSGDTVTIGTKVYTFVPTGTANADGEIAVGANVAASKVNLVAAINGLDGISTPNPVASAAAFVADDMAITALIGGTAGDSIATTETFTAGGNIFAAVALAGGGDCTAANAILALVAAVTASDTQGVGAVDGAGDTVVFTADVAGPTGNAIAIAEDMANATFAAGAIALSGGVAGTVSDGVKFMIDATYLYVSLAANTVAGQNWRRMTLGSVY